MDELNKLRKEKNKQLESWCNCAEGKVGEDLEKTDKIIATLAKELNILDRYLQLQEISRGLSTDTIKRLIDEHYKNTLGIDEKGGWIEVGKL